MYPRSTSSSRDFVFKNPFASRFRRTVFWASPTFWVACWQWVANSESQLGWTSLNHWTWKSWHDMRCNHLKVERWKIATHQFHVVVKWDSKCHAQGIERYVPSNVEKLLVQDTQLSKTHGQKQVFEVGIHSGKYGKYGEYKQQVNVRKWCIIKVWHASRKAPASRLRFRYLASWRDIPQPSQACKDA